LEKVREKKGKLAPSQVLFIGGVATLGTVHVYVVYTVI
jgi:hypothetical protein